MQLISRLESDLRRLQHALAMSRKENARLLIQLGENAELMHELRNTIQALSCEINQLHEERRRLHPSQDKADRVEVQSAALNQNHWIGENANLQVQIELLRSENERLRQEIARLSGGLHPFQCRQGLQPAIATVRQAKKMCIDTWGHFIKS